MLDAIGLSRCYGLVACRQAGETCADSIDCCRTANDGGVPCIPADGGGFACAAASCQPLRGVCATTGDCCGGLTCVLDAPGAAHGTCDLVVPLPSDGGTAAARPLATDSGTLSCSFAGQSCAQDVDCCYAGDAGGAACLLNGAPCSGQSRCQCF
jgi:hypothetical protein